MDATNPNTGGNLGLLDRHKWTKEGNIVSLEGPIHADICQLDRAILNDVPLTIRLYPSLDSFRLMADNDVKYKVEITDAVLKLCYVAVNPQVIVGHNEALQITEAVYPFWKSTIKTYGIASGNFTFSCEDILSGMIPSKVLVAFVSSESYAGSYKFNPYNFANFDLNYLSLEIDGNSVPGRPYQPNFGTQDYAAEYLSLFFDKYPAHGGNFITRVDYLSGYTVYGFNVEGQANDKVMVKPKKGHTKLSVRFGTKLPKPVTCIVYSISPSVMRIDKARNIIL